MVCYIFKGVLGMARYIIYFFILSFLFLGCSRYDAKTPDTQANRKGFAHIIGFSPTSDVTEIYFYADEMGFEPLYCLAFQSSPKNVKKIIEKFNLKKNNNTNWEEPFAVPKDLFWWNAEERKKSEFYSSQVEQTETAYYFWYNPQNSKCQFMMVCF